MSNNKIEKKAITKFRELIDSIQTIDYSFDEEDKKISWDGKIYLYKNNEVDKKESFEDDLPVQIKGRTAKNKDQFVSKKYRFGIERADLENYLKKDGTLLLICLFKKESEDYKMYYLDLLPYNINLKLKEYPNSQKINVDTKLIKDEKQFESICRNFKLDRDNQKRLNKNIFNQNNVMLSDNKTSKIYEWTGNNYDLRNIIGQEKYIYTFDEKGNIINVELGLFSKLIENTNSKVYDKDKEIEFCNIKRITTMEGIIQISFGKGFLFSINENIKEYKFETKICGGIYERIKQLKFINRLFTYKCFYINEMKINVEIEGLEQEKFKVLLEKYEKILNFLNNHKVNKSLNLDEWDDNDFHKLDFWINVFENKNPINLNIKENALGHIKIKDLNLSILAIKRTDNNFDVFNLWGNNDTIKFSFKYGKDIFDSITTDKLFLIINKEAYLADDIDYEEMKKVINKKNLCVEEYELVNLQLLEVLKAYDINKNIRLLEYAEYLVDVLLENDSSSEIYYINYAQILKRKDKLVNENFKRLMDIKDGTDNIEIKLGCSLLLENKNETNILISEMQVAELEEFKKFPIAIYLN